jgi:hypothetical protein
VDYQEEVAEKGFWGQCLDVDEEDELLSQAGLENEISRQTETIDFTNRNTGVTSVVSSGMDTPAFSEIRKQAITSMDGDDTDASSGGYGNQVDRPLYQVLQQHEVCPFLFLPLNLNIRLPIKEDS